MDIPDRYTKRALALLRAVNGMEAENGAQLRALGLELRSIIGGAYAVGMLRRELAALVLKIEEAVGFAFDAIAAAHTVALPQLAAIEAEWAGSTLQGARIASQTAIDAATRSLLVQGSPLADLWEQQAVTLARRATAAVRTAAAQSEPVAPLIRSIVGNQRTGLGGLIEKARTDAAALTDTAAHTAAYAARIVAFKAKGANALEWFSILDGKTTIGCAIRAGKLYTLDFEPIGHAVPIERPPPRHYRCRSILIPHKFPNGPPADGGPDRDSFETFLSRHSEAEQDDMLGPRRAELWREGKITLSDLIGQRGQTMTLAELKAAKH